MKVKVKRPEWPVGQLATFELRDYREELEQALDGLPGESAERDQLQQRLAEVISEQESRLKGG